MIRSIPHHPSNMVLLWLGIGNGQWLLMELGHWCLLMTTDRSSRMNSEVCRALLSAQIQPNSEKVTGRCCTVQMDNDPKHTVKATQKGEVSQKDPHTSNN